MDQHGAPRVVFAVVVEYMHRQSWIHSARFAGHDGEVRASRIPATAAHVFVADVHAPALAPDDAHHLARVLRLRDGEAVTVSDGRGGWRRCVFRGNAALEAAGDVTRVDAPARSVTVAMALTKGEKPELAVQKLTELGVDRIVLLDAARSVVRWDEDKSARNLDRLRTVARAAAMQSRRVVLPVVEPLTTLDALAAADPQLLLAHPDGEPLPGSATSVAVGPEGGWSDAELRRVKRHVDLGATTLRAETAAIAAAVLLTALRDGRIRAE